MTFEKSSGKERSSSTAKRDPRKVELLKKILDTGLKFANKHEEFESTLRRSMGLVMKIINADSMGAKASTSCMKAITEEIDLSIRKDASRREDVQG